LRKYKCPSLRGGSAALPGRSVEEQENGARKPSLTTKRVKFLKAVEETPYRHR